MPLPDIFSGSSKGRALVNRHIVTNFSRLSNHNALCMIDKKTFPDFGSRMNVYSCEKPAPGSDQAGEAFPSMGMKKIGPAVHPYRPEARIAEKNFPSGIRCRIPVKDTLDIASKGIKHFRLCS
jgi:hypothetical protein